jgi:hypothetical protein
VLNVLLMKEWNKEEREVKKKKKKRINTTIP